MPVRVVLVVDDDKDIGEFLGTVMREEFAAKVLLTGDVQDAVELALEARPELALIDISRPGRLDLVRQLKHDRSTASMPVVCITIPGERSEALRAGCVYCLDKPFELDLLIDIVEKCLGRQPA